MDIKKILPENGPPIDQVSKYIEKYKNDLIVIKYGGNVFIDRNIFNNFIEDIGILNKLGLSIVVIHGGGPRIKRELDKSNINSTFIRDEVKSLETMLPTWPPVKILSLICSLSVSTSIFFTKKLLLKLSK